MSYAPCDLNGRRLCGNGHKEMGILRFGGLAIDRAIERLMAEAVNTEPATEPPTRSPRREPQSSSGDNASIGIFFSMPMLIGGTNASSTTTKIAIAKIETKVRCSD